MASSYVSVIQFCENGLMYTAEYLKHPGQTTWTSLVSSKLLDHLQIIISDLCLELPKNEEFVDENGVRTTIEYTLNEEGKKVKVWVYLNCGQSLFMLTMRCKTRSLAESNERCKSPSSTIPSQSARNGRSSDKRKETSQVPTGPPPPSERMLL
jgi:hypothetical protein